MKNVIIGLGILLIIASCVTAFYVFSKSDPLVPVGGYDYHRDPEHKAERVLLDKFHKEGIGAMIYGSAGYTIAVSESQAQLAKSIMVRVIKEHGYETIFSINY